MEFLNASFVAHSTQESDISNDLLYTGRRRDPETGLQLNRNRFYIPPLGRWVNRDPIGYEGSPYNLYEYVNGRVTVGVDPFGEFKWPWEWRWPKKKPKDPPKDPCPPDDDCDAERKAVAKTKQQIKELEENIRQGQGDRRLLRLALRVLQDKLRADERALQECLNKKKK